MKQTYQINVHINEADIKSRFILMKQTYKTNGSL